jgi:nitroreductase
VDVGDAIRRRHMVRNYDASKPVTRAQLDTLLELATHAPSAGFSQGWRFLVLDQPAAIDTFWQVSQEEGPPDSWLLGMRRAPALIFALSEKEIYLDRYAEADKGWTDRDEARWPVPYWHIDTGMAALLILLGAQELGLASCLFGVPASRWEAVRAAFAIPAGLGPVAVISIGHPAPDVRSPSLQRGRRPVAEIAAYNRF